MDKLFQMLLSEIKTLGEGWQELPSLSCRYLLNLPKKIIDDLLAKIYGRSGARIESFQNSSSGWERGDSSEGALDQKNSSRTSFALRTVTLFLYCCILFFCTIVYSFSVLLYIISVRQTICVFSQLLKKLGWVGK